MSKRRYTHVKELLPEVQRLKQKGYTHQQVAIKLKLASKEVVEQLLKRERARKRNISDVQPPKQHGRKLPLTLQDYKYECKRLKMENELLRDFLHLAGRR